MNYFIPCILVTGLIVSCDSGTTSKDSSAQTLDDSSSTDELATTLGSIENTSAMSSENYTGFSVTLPHGAIVSSNERSVLISHKVQVHQ